VPLTPVTAVATVVGCVAVLAGAAWIRDPPAVHDLQVAYLGSTRRDDETVRRGALPRGVALLVLGVLCLLFVVVSV
jgi:uncharacterized membrane protein HdeD (DUF308 family)